MNSISISETTTVLNSTYYKNFKQELYRILDLYNHFGTPIFILFPRLIFQIFDKNTFNNSLLLGFLPFGLPFIHLALMNFRLYRNIDISRYKPPSRSHFIFYMILKFFFLSSSIISIFLIFFLRNFNDLSISRFSSVFFPFALSTAYLLSISCSFIPGSISFIDSDADAVIDLLLLLSSLSGLFLVRQRKDKSSFLFIFSFLLVLLRSLKERYYPGKKSAKITPLRQVLFVFIVAIPVMSYDIISIPLIYMLIKNIYRSFPSINK
ncbi:DUF2463 domain-containing protein [Encephalitozoon intestinalis]|nr:DUF2463 domain-containing protein [Encephalitozoon intestinalis]